MIPFVHIPADPRAKGCSYAVMPKAILATNEAIILRLIERMNELRGMDMQDASEMFSGAISLDPRGRNGRQDPKDRFPASKYPFLGRTTAGDPTLLASESATGTVPMRECRVLCSYDTIWFENTDPYFSAHIGLRSLCPALAFSEVQAIRRMGVQTMLDRWPEAAAEDLANGLEVLLDGNLVKRDVRGDVHAADLLPLLQHASHDIRRAARLLIPIVGVTESLPLNQERRGVRL